MHNVVGEKVLQFELRGNGVGIVTIDYPGEKVNKLSSNVFLELENLLKDVSANMEVKTLIFVSGKKDNFIAGADIDEIKDIKTIALGKEMSSRAQNIFNRLERSRMTTIAVINGACLGGGLEFALACDYRIISDSPKTVLGLPEVKLGLIPGAGGTQRLPRLVGLQQSLDIILTGKNIRPKKALKIGLADELVPVEIIMEIALRRAEDFAARGKLVSPPKRKEVKDWLLEETRIGKNMILKKARENVMLNSGGKYPAPLKALEVIMDGIDLDLEKGLELEAHAFGELCETSVSKNLIHLFEATTELKKPFKEIKEPLPEVKKVGILGAGLMGAGIAKVTLDMDIPVRMRDINKEAIGRSLKSINDYFQKKVKKKILSPYEATMKTDLVSGTTDFSGFKHTDIVIEAVFEDAELKRDMFRELEQVVSDKCIFASNTSSIPIAEIAKGLRHPENVIGMHFFSPVEKMPLLEVIVTEKTADHVIAVTVELGKKMGKTVIVVNDGLGFYTTRTLAPYMNEALHILMEGGDIEQIDRVMTDFGFPVGPFKLLDEVGIDVGTKVTKLLAPVFPRMKPPVGLEPLLEKNRFGKKNQKGFYTYSDAKTSSKDVDHSVYDDLGLHSRRAFTDEEIKNRLVYTFLNEAALCLEDGILNHVRDGDIGAVFGLGFPPFLGGPFKYMDTLGLDNVAETLEKLKEKYGDRFLPSKKLTELAAKKENFY